MKAFRFLLSLTVASLLAVHSSKAVMVYALTTNGHILTFEHAAPDSILRDVTVTGQGAYELLAIDVRPTVQIEGASNPGVGSLWAIGKSGTSFQLFVISPTTGAASAIGAPINAGISGTPGNDDWGFDFNPVVDRIRLVDSSASNNYRLNPNNGQLAATDGTLAFSAGDPNFGVTPQVDAAAYSSAAFAGATSLFYIDPNLDILATSSSPNSGQLQTIGMLGVNIDKPNGFDINGNLALFSVPGLLSSSLYSVNTMTGSATLIGAFPLTTNLRGLAISITVPADTKPVVKVLGKLTKTTTSSRYDLQFRATDDSGVVAASFRQVRQSKTFKAVRSSTSLYVAKVRRLEIGNNRVNVRAIDPAGQQATVKVVIRRESSN